MTARELRQEYDAYSRQLWEERQQKTNFADYVALVVLPRECAAAVDKFERERTASYIQAALDQANRSVYAVAQPKGNGGLGVGKIEKL
jgi:hypothetical protein